MKEARRRARSHRVPLSRQAGSVHNIWRHLDMPVDVQREAQGLPEQDTTLSWKLCTHSGRCQATTSPLVIPPYLLGSPLAPTEPVKRLVNRDHFACQKPHVAEKPQPLLPLCVEREVTLETSKSVMLGLAWRLARELPRCHTVVLLA